MNLLKVDTIEQVNDKLARYFRGRAYKTEPVGLSHAAGRVLAGDVFSDTDMPEFTRSIVDGYAVKASGTFGAGEAVPIFLKIVGESQMGLASDITINDGEAVYVPTGGMLPNGSDAMVMIEYSELLSGDEVAIYKSAAPGSGVMAKGEDFPAGRLMLRDGHRIGAKETGILACLGNAHVTVYQKPTVALISTGDELIDISEKPAHGQIRDINAHLIGAFLDRLGARVTKKLLIRDDFDALKNAVRQSAGENDIVLISGGSSQGNKDMTERVISSMGSPGVFTHGIALKPGKPTILGAVGEGDAAKLIAGLPGHPMSAIVAYLAVIEPFIRKYFLNNASPEFQVLAKATENIHAGEGRETWQPVKINRRAGGGLEAAPIYAKSGSIYQLALADGFIKIPVMSEGIAAGDIVDVTLIGAN